MELKDLDRKFVIDYVATHDVSVVAKQIVFRSGFRCNLSGTKYLQSAIIIKYNDENVSCGKDLYALVAKQYGVTPQKVERCIRNTVQDCYSSGKLRALNDLFGVNSIGRCAPSNMEFIMSVCAWISITKACNSSTAVAE